jgi:predicted DNA-binding mobile mystery protein A
MTTRSEAVRARRRLDERLRRLGPADRYAPPRRGWVRAVREALGMSLADLGGRMGVSAATVAGLEHNEQAGTVRLDTLRRAAEALDCTLAYVLIPKTSLHETVRTAAERLLDSETGAAEHSMALEDQRTDLSRSARAAMVDRLVATGRLWAPP